MAAQYQFTFLKLGLVIIRKVECKREVSLIVYILLDSEA